jgi:hypothetical protein
MKIFLATKILTLEKKSDIFINEFYRIIQFLPSFELQGYLGNHILPDNYLDNLVLLKE